MERQRGMKRIFVLCVMSVIMLVCLEGCFISLEERDRRERHERDGEHEGRHEERQKSFYPDEHSQPVTNWVLMPQSNNHEVQWRKSL